MSFFLDPPALLFLGAVIAIIHGKKWISGQKSRLLGLFIIILFIISSALLYLDILYWPLNFTGEPISGSYWMYHTDLTGIYKNMNPNGGVFNPPLWPASVAANISLVVPGTLAVVQFMLYPIWLILGYLVIHNLFYRKKYKIQGGIKYIDDIKSKDRFSPEPLNLVVSRNPDKLAALDDAISKFGGLEEYIKSGDTVVIKANICGGNPYIKGSYTDPDLVGVVTQKISQITGKNVTVCDSDMVWTDFEPVAKLQGWYEAASKYKFDLVNLADSTLTKFDFGPLSKTAIQLVSTTLVNADVIISFPTTKTHLLTSMTCGMKNMYGTFPEGSKAKFHKIGIETVVVDMIRAFRPTLTIVDGTIGGEAIGPLSCKPLPDGGGQTIIMANDVVAADSTVLQLMGYKLEEIVHVNNASEEGLGNGNVPFDFSSLPYALPKDGKWERPQPKVSQFYDDLIMHVTKAPEMVGFMNDISPVFLYDAATLPFLKDITPIALTVLSDAVGGLLSLTKGLRFKESDLVKQKIGENEFPTIREQMWPTEHLKHKLETIGLTAENEHMYPETADRKCTEIVDKEEKAKFAERFMPRVSTVGLELRAESKTPAWAGVQYQLVESKDQSQRLLQNMLVWTKQNAFFSQFYSYILPFLLAILGIIIVSSVKASSVDEGIISILIVFAVLFVLGGPILIRTLIVYFLTREFIFRVPIILTVYGALFLIGIYDIFDKIDGSSAKLFQIPIGSGNIIDFYFPLVSIIFLIFSLGSFFAARLLAGSEALASHNMDYGPLWVYLTKKDLNGVNTDPDSWVIDRIYYDAYHYEVEYATRDKLKSLNALETDNRAMFEIESNWHSFNVANSFSNKKAWFGLIISIFGLIGMIIAPILFFGSTLLMILITGFFLVLIIGLWLFVAKYRYTLVLNGKTESEEMLKSPRKIFSSGKFDVVWNLREYAAKLKIKDKITDPFNPQLNWGRFDDKIEPDPVIDVSFQITRSKLFNILVFSFWAGLFAIILFTEGYISGAANKFALIGFGFVLVGTFTALLVVDYEPLQILLLTGITAIFAFIDEIIFTGQGLWTYGAGVTGYTSTITIGSFSIPGITIGGLSIPARFIGSISIPDPNGVLFAVTGWPILILFIFVMGHFLQAILNTREVMEIRFSRLIWGLPLATFYILIFSILIFLYPNFTSAIFGSNLAFGLIIVLVFIGTLYIIITPFKDTVGVTLVALVVGLLMEFVGSLSGWWEYINGAPSLSMNTLDYFLGQFPLFIGILWIYRVATILLILKLISRDKPVYKDL